METVPCPCCGYITLEEKGGYDICPICWWEDDGQDDPEADEVCGVNSDLSLTQARINFIKKGISDPTREDLIPERYIEYKRGRLFVLDKFDHLVEKPLNNE